MLAWLWRFNKTKRRVRWPAKWAVMALVVLFVCFPSPARLITHLRHWSDPNAMIEPDAPALVPLVEALRPLIREAKKPTDALRIVERFVYRSIPYDWDWNTWGAVDYLPTVTEVIERGREDCDGQAVVAASLLRNFGFEAELVANFSHMWVRTNRGEAMSPGKNSAVVATKTGPKFSWRGLLELPKATAFGIGVFPFIREFVIVIVLWLMLLGEDRSGRRQVITLLVFTGGLLALRYASSDYRKQIGWLQLLAVFAMLAGLYIQIRRARAPVLRDDKTAPTT